MASPARPASKKMTLVTRICFIAVSPKTSRTHVGIGGGGGRDDRVDQLIRRDIAELVIRTNRDFPDRIGESAAGGTVVVCNLVVIDIPRTDCTCWIDRISCASLEIGQRPGIRVVPRIGNPETLVPLLIAAYGA